MEDVKFAITDIETAGGGIRGNKITEICVIVVQNGEVIDQYSSLVNPEQSIPLYIESLTGINDEMVSNAPHFSEIADEVDRITKDCIFVAHNVNFDYNIIRSEFIRSGTGTSKESGCVPCASLKSLSPISSPTASGISVLLSIFRIPIVTGRREMPKLL